MARYTGPKRKLERREGTSLFGSNAWEKRPGFPGQHPTSRGRSSEFAIRFRERQKVKRMYGLLEKQFKNLVGQALESTGNSGTRLLQLLELRLDNVVYKLGYAKTRNQARQFVTHAHVKVNDKILSIPSYSVKIGDKVEIITKIYDSEPSKNLRAEVEKIAIPEWLEKSQNSGKVLAVPARVQLDQSINERLIIEYYSR